MKKIINAVLTCISIIVVLILGTKFLKNENNNSEYTYPNQFNQLKKVKNLKFNDKDYLFTWDSVENADGYIIEINEEQYNIEENQYFYVPIESTTTARVQATDSTGEYVGSNWSDICTYKIDNSKNVITYASVNAFVNDMLPDCYQFRKIVSMHIKDDTLYTRAVFSNAARTKDMLYELEHKYDHELQGLADAMDEDMPNTYIYASRDTVTYNSAKYLIESNEFVGELEEYRQQGYEVSVVSSQTEKDNGGNGDNSTIYATYKLTNGSDTKFAQSIISYGVVNPSANKQVNYTIKLSNPETRTLWEDAFNLIEGDLAEFAAIMDSVNNNNNNNNI